ASSIHPTQVELCSFSRPSSCDLQFTYGGFFVCLFVFGWLVCLLVLVF
uniref:T15 class I MHC gene (exon 5) n=1 Tax=Mus musculus TaxID=10090 RepID=Q31227_MOUSE|nr:unnamed protein product [Mus musculus]